ncbi:glutathione S-transferase [Pararobbsia alpina]|uniref:glutathione S-transferase family protein n=1 Tax=Pararobbsia alpina TaxID=621374 RepID=UPI0039A555CB
MKLIGPWLSGYTRRVGVTLNLLDIKYEHLNYHAYKQRDLVRQFSPMVRVPALQLNDGEVLIDSNSIVDYLDSLVEPEQRLIPAGGHDRRRVMQWVGYATACYDKLARYCDESMLRPKEHQLAPLQAEYERQLVAGLDVLNKERPSPWLLGSRITQGDVMAVIAYQGASLVIPASANAERFPNLAALSDRAMQMPAFNTTLPSLAELAESGLAPAAENA